MASEVSYALYPHADRWQQALTVRRGYEFNYPLSAVQVEAHGCLMPPRQSFIAIEPNHVTLTAVKKAEDSHALVLHIYGWAGQAGAVSIAVPPRFTSASQTNLIEDSEGAALPIENGKISVTIRPYQIVGIKVNYPDGGGVDGSENELHAIH